MYCIYLYIIIIYILWLWTHVSYLRDKMNAIVFISIFYEKLYCIKRNTRRDDIYLNSDIRLCISEARVVNKGQSPVISGQQVSRLERTRGLSQFLQVETRDHERMYGENESESQSGFGGEMGYSLENSCSGIIVFFQFRVRMYESLEIAIWLFY